jgi:hypothetical protein
MAKNPERDRAISVRIDKLTREEQHKLSDSIINAKREIAPDARGTIVEGSQSQLSSKPMNQLDPEDE